MSLWTSDAIAAATGGAASAPFNVDGVAFDSREVGPGDLFIALKGEATDGHRFVEQAFAQGAAGRNRQCWMRRAAYRGCRHDECAKCAGTIRACTEQGDGLSA